MEIISRHRKDDSIFFRCAAFALAIPKKNTCSNSHFSNKATDHCSFNGPTGTVGPARTPISTDAFTTAATVYATFAKAGGRKPEVTTPRDNCVSERQSNVFSNDPTAKPASKHAIFEGLFDQEKMN